MSSGFVSNFNDSGYSFTVPGGSSSSIGDGMILASRIISVDPSGLILENRPNANASDALRSGANVFYPQPGTFTRQAENTGVEYWSTSTTGVNGNSNWSYGVFPTANPTSSITTAFVRGGTVTGTSSDIYNFTNPGVFLVNTGTTALYPILSSVPNLRSVFEVPINTADWVLVYPGWGFRTFDGGANSQSSFYNVNWVAISYTYFNDTNQPLVFTFAQGWTSNTKMIGSNLPSPTQPTQPAIQMQSTFISIPIITQVRGNGVFTQNDDIHNRSTSNDVIDGIQIFYRSATPLFRFGMTIGTRNTS